MLETLLVEMRSPKERRLAEGVLKGKGYDVAVTLRRCKRLQVRVRPGEKPQAALRAAGVEFSFPADMTAAR
jgi:hypothetical protein